MVHFLLVVQLKLNTVDIELGAIFQGLGTSVADLGFVDISKELLVDGTEIKIGGRVLFNQRKYIWRTKCDPSEANVDSNEKISIRFSNRVDLTDPHATKQFQADLIKAFKATSSPLQFQAGKEVVGDKSSASVSGFDYSEPFADTGDAITAEYLEHAEF